MYEMQAQVTSIIPGETPCLSCIFPDFPDEWKREFPVFGAVSGTVGCVAAMEAIKIISGLGDPLFSRMLLFDLRDVSFLTRNIKRLPNCAICG